MLDYSAKGASRPPCALIPSPRSPQGVASEDNARSRRQGDAYQSNLGKYAAKNAAAKLLQNHDPKLSQRISHCGYVARQSVVMLDRNDGTGRAGFDGLKTCLSVWSCPVCSQRISAGRKLELDQLLAAARAERLAVVMLTLTARHNRRTDLASFLASLKDAKQKMQRRRDWQVLPIVAMVTATEATFGSNGFHPHFHSIVVLDCPAAEAADLLERMRSGWLTSLETCGLSGNQAAFHVQPASAVGDYLAKWGAAEELSLQGYKVGRKGSRTPFQLLADAEQGDKQACAAWVQFALAFKGRRQLVWSRGAKARFGIAEKTDDELSGEAVPEPVTLRAWLGNGDCWRSARRRRVALVRAAESGLDLDAAEFGPTDSVAWRRIGGGLVIEPSPG